MLRTLHTTILLLGILGLSAQLGKWEEIPLTDLAAFHPQTGNWSIVGEVQMDPDISVKRKPNMAEEEPSGSKRKRKRKGRKAREQGMLPPSPISWEAGKGILLNMNTDSLRSNLLSVWEHGDLEIEIEVMVPKGSNSGIYFQGRYEIQILDSYGKEHPKFGDMGGIYRKWGGNPDEVYMGKPPFVNAAKAPGLWQTFRIGFQAPRFDENGQKVANAKFIYVDLNGVRIHQNVEVPYTTRGAISRKEVPMGPFQIQGDHGPVAFRHFRYRKLTPQALSLTDIHYQAYKGKFTSLAEIASLTKVAEGDLEDLSCRIGGLSEPFTIVYTANFHVEESGKHAIRLATLGSFQFDRDGETLAMHRNKTKWKIDHTANLTLDLQAGDNPFTLVYYKTYPRHDRGLGFFNISSYPVALHDEPSFAPKPKTPPIELEALNRPRLVRGFLKFKKGEGETLTHTLAVGNPQGVHFVYDLKTGTPACVWRGPFGDVAPMWVARAGGAFRPLGAVQFLCSGQSIASLPDSMAPFPRLEEDPAHFHNQGYKLEKDTGLPIFLYSVEGHSIEDILMPDEKGNGVVRKLTIPSLPPSMPFYLKLAEGQEITQISARRYLIDQQYYVEFPDVQSAFLRKMGDQTELVVNLKAGVLQYSLIW